MKKVAIITNYNITDKMSAACAVAEKVRQYAEKILIPVNYTTYIISSTKHDYN